MAQVLKREIFGSEPQEVVALMNWAQDVAGLSDNALARRMGVGWTTVQMYRVGRRPKPGWGFVVRWLRACGFRITIDA